MEKPQNLKNTKSLKKQKGVEKDESQESPDYLSKEMLDELDRRYQHAIEHLEEGSSWEEVKARLLSE